MTSARLKSYSDRATWIALAGGVALFAWLVWKVDTRPLVAVFRDSAHWVVAIALLYGLFQFAYCMGWRETLRPCPVPFGRLLGLYQAGDTLSYVVPLAGLVVPVQLARLLAAGELVRAVAERLVVRQPAFAEPLLLAVDDEGGGPGCGAFHDTCHGNSSLCRSGMLH